MTTPENISWGVVGHHPSRRAEVARTYELLARRLVRERPGYVLWCLDTSLDGALAHVAKAPAGGEVTVAPLLLAPGKHYAEDVRRLADALAAARPDLTVRVRPPLIEDESFLTSWLARL
jgi:sirohydrochlorin ferrochelatase